MRSCCLVWLQRQKLTKETRGREHTWQDEGPEAPAYVRNHHSVARRMLLGGILETAIETLCRNKIGEDINTKARGLDIFSK